MHSPRKPTPSLLPRRRPAEPPVEAQTSSPYPFTDRSDQLEAEAERQREFAAFVTENREAMRRIVARRLLDTPGDIDDALQEGLVRIWHEFPSFPEDPRQRAAYAGQLLNRASIDVVRRKWGRNLQRRDRELIVDFTVLERRTQDRDAPAAELQRTIARMADLDDLDTDSDELHRRLVALKTMLPALKPIELDVLLAHHPDGGSRKGPEVAERLGITHGQVRQHYMEAMAILRPLLAHALAPDLPAEEADRVLDYTAGVMSDKRQRGRMKRHLKHCEACRKLADGQKAVIGVGANLILPLQALGGIGGGAAASGGAATAGGAALAGGGVVTGIAAKLALGGAVVTTAFGGAATMPHHETQARPHQTRPASRPHRTPTPAPAAPAPARMVAPARVAVAPTAAPTRAPAAPTPTASPVPTAAAAPSEFALERLAASGAGRTETFTRTTPTDNSASGDEGGEFAP